MLRNVFRNRLFQHRLFQHKLGRRSIAAVEFALVMPLLLVMFIGTIEVLTLYRTEAKLNAVAFNVAQEISISQSVSTAPESNEPLQPVNAPNPATADSSTENVVSLNDLCQGAVLGMSPFPAAGMTIAIASITEEAGPAGMPQTSSAYSGGATSGPYFDEWESDSTVAAGGTCTTPTNATSPTKILSGTGASAPITIAMPPSSTSLIAYPCDNAIIVQVSVPYAGITGLILQSRPTLTQTAYLRWRPALPTTELQCTGCTLVPSASDQSAQQICNANNTQAYN